MISSNIARRRLAAAALMLLAGVLAPQHLYAAQNNTCSTDGTCQYDSTGNYQCCSCSPTLDPLGNGSAAADTCTWQSASTICIPPPASGGYNCLVCGWMTKLENMTAQLTRAVFKQLVPVSAKLGAACGIIAACLLVGQLMLGGPSAEETIARLAGWFTAVVVCGLLLGAGNVTAYGLTGSSQGVGSPGPTAIAYIFDPLQLAGLGTAASVFQALDSVQGAPSWINITNVASSATSNGGSTQPGPYSALWGQVEAVVYRIFELAVSTVHNSGWADAIIAVFFWALALLPYLLVMMIFGWYLLQTMFYFAAVAGTAPILIGLMPLKPFRSFFFAGLRFCWGGTLTIVFASFAMTLTGAVVNGALNDVMATIGQVSNDQACQSLGGVAIKGPQGSATGSLFYSGAFFTLIIFGGLSAMLHLQAPRIASNISGANDSATSAAAVAGLGGAGAAKGIGMASRIFMGNPSKTGKVGGIAGALYGFMSRAMARGMKEG